MKKELAMLGLGSRSTSFYLSELNRQYNKIMGGYSTCPLILLNTNFNQINSLLPNVSEQLDKLLKERLSRLIGFDNMRLIIPNITLHETIDRLKLKVDIVHPINLTLKYILGKNWNKVFLFGSLYSMKSSYILSHLKDKGVNVVLPTENDMVFIDQMRQAVYNETESIEMIDQFHTMMRQYSINLPVLLSCTELSVLNPKDDPRVVDMTQLQIKEAVNRIT